MALSNATGVPTTEKVAAARLSIFSNTLLMAMKFAVGFATGSVSVLSEGLHSSADLLASWIAFFSVRAADRPADQDHPYGHGKIESLSGLAEALLIFAAAGYIIFESIHKLMSREAPQRLDLGILVMAISAVMNTFIGRYLYRVARRTDSLALEADAAHLTTDVLTSAGVTIGLVLVRVTGWHMLDPIVAMAVALVIVQAAWRLSRTALGPLIDTRLPMDDVAVVIRVLDAEPGVRAYHKLRTRKSGSYRYVDAHVLLEDDLGLVEAHNLTEQIEDRIRGELPNVEVTLHMEPYREERVHQYEHHGGPPPEDENVAKREIK